MTDSSEICKISLIEQNLLVIESCRIYLKQFCVSLDSLSFSVIDILVYYMAGSMSGQDEENPVL